MRAFSEYFSRLSIQQKRWYVAGFALSVAIVAIGTIMSPVESSKNEVVYSTEQSIGQIAPDLEVTGKALAKELGLSLDISKKRPLHSLGISQEKLDSVTKHLKSHKPKNLAYYVIAALAGFGLLYLVRLGRPDNCPVKDRKYWYNRTPIIITLIVTTLVAGFLTGKSPNPMEGVVKVFKTMVGLYPTYWDKLLVLAFFIGLAIIGNKIICGWACPFGAIQELIYSIPVLKNLKRKKLPFVVSNTIRIALFVIALFLLFGIFGDRKGYVVYHGVNPFNLFNFDLETTSLIITVVASIILSVFIYRPFCHLICPFGLISWIVEKLSLARIRIDPNKCTMCGACAKACPSQAALGRLKQGSLPPDCFSCARCLNVCPEDAIEYSFPKSDKNPKKCEKSVE